MFKNYRAPWSPLLIWVSALATLLCVGISISAVVHSGPYFIVSGLLPLALVLGCALFTVRGYVLTLDAILVQRLFWFTRLPRAGLVSAVFTPGAMKSSLRTCGNGGFYSFSGWYWNRTLGSYRAFVTEPKNSVVLRYGRRTIVISPADPEEFVRELDVAPAPITASV